MPYIKKYSFYALVFANIYNSVSVEFKGVQLNILKSEFRISRKISFKGQIQAFEIHFAETFCPAKGQIIQSSSQLGEINL